jgi:hypothetical protein
MNKRGVEAGTVVGVMLLIILVATAFYGFFSTSICDKLLIGVGVFGLLWLFFGSPLLIKIEQKNFIIFSFSTIACLVLWIILNTTGACVTWVDAVKSLPI